MNPIIIPEPVFQTIILCLIGAVFVCLIALCLPSDVGKD